VTEGVAGIVKEEAVVKEAEAETGVADVMVMVAAAAEVAAVSWTWETGAKYGWLGE
jgi:hypothetical protein